MNKRPIVINQDVIFASGYYNGAIYDFNNNRIYSVNHDANEFLLRFVHGGTAETEEEKEYLCQLEQKNLFCRDFLFKEYIPNLQKQNKLNFAWLEVTQKCNLRCVHCYEGEVHQSGEDLLSVTDWKRIIKDLCQCGCPNIQFIGGEPTCYLNIIELIDYAGTMDFRSLGFFTNATRISEELLACLIRNHVKVNISIYGHCAQLHDSITKIQGSFNKTVDNIKKMLESGIQVKAAITVMHENEDHFEDIVDFVKNIGINYYKYDLFREVKECRQGCHLTTRNDLINKKYRTKPNFSISKDWFERAFSVNTCWYGKFSVTENGKVIPCVFERNITYGNLKACSVKQLLESELLDFYWRMDFSKIEKCKDCEYRFACKDCRPLGELNGGLESKSIRCLYNPLTGLWRKT